MPLATDYDRLCKRLSTIRALEETSALLHWDQETMMPARGAEARGEQLAALEHVLHAQRTAPELADLLEHCLEQVDERQASPIQRANLRLTRRMIARAQSRPAALMADLARQTALAHGIWAKARADKHFADFAPALARMVELKRQEAACLGYQDTPYDALLDEWEPGATTREVSDLLDRLRPHLCDLLDSIVGSEVTPPEPSHDLPKEAQLTLSRLVATAMGYDFKAGRLDLAVHPFCSGGVPGDVRITTRVRRDNLEDCLYATIHETGHALYEQGIDPALTLLPVGQSVSMGVHESQSRLWENQIGRSLAFAEWLLPHASRILPLKIDTPMRLHQAVNRVAQGFIRVDADEVTYNLHIILRFDLERQLIEGTLEVADLEAAWNARMEQDLGITPPDAALGVLQDVHWAAGAWGYFPTYTLGNVYAAELHQAMTNALPELDNLLRQGELQPVRSWLREEVHQHGSTYLAKELIGKAVGHPPSEEPLLAYLKERFGALYKL